MSLSRHLREPRLVLADRRRHRLGHGQVETGQQLQARRGSATGDRWRALAYQLAERIEQRALPRQTAREVIRRLIQHALAATHMMLLHPPVRLERARRNTRAALRPLQIFGNEGWA